ncbi:MAG: thioredoxin family protein [Candidatus Micrarchaeaceae archaeon]
MAYIDEKSKKLIIDRFSKELKGDVNLILFKDSMEKCHYCNDVEGIIQELSSLDSRLKVTVYEINKNDKEAKFLGVDKVPALILGGSRIYNILYFGLPSGYEFSSLLDDIIDVSKGETKLSEEVKRDIRSISKKVDIKIFVTPTCPYCPRAVRVAHQFALENINIKSSMIEAIEFPELSNKYGVMAVPKIVINDRTSFEGAYPERDFLVQIMQDLEKK